MRLINPAGNNAALLIAAKCSYAIAASRCGALDRKWN